MDEWVESAPGHNRPSPSVFWKAKDRSEATAALKAWWGPFGRAKPMGQPEGTGGELEAVRIGSAVFLTLRHGAWQFIEHPARQREAQPRWLAIECIAEGIEHGQVAGEPYDCQVGEVILRDWSRPGEWERPAATVCRSLFVPAHAAPIHLFMRGQPGRWSWPVESPAGQLLATVLDAAATTRQADDDTQDNFLSAVHGLIAGLVPRKASEETDDSGLPPVAGLMRDYLRAHLRDENLGVAHLVTRFRCARSTVYRCFADVGGVRAFVQRERLVACRAALRSALIEEGNPSIAAMALNWGYKEPAHFVRAFRTTYEETPGTWLARERAKYRDPTSNPFEGRDGVPVEIQTIQRWLGLRNE